MHAHPSSSLIRIALVEDNINFQNALIDAIRSAPDMALQSTANTREQGLQMLEQLQADVLLVDLGLPDGSGVDVIRAAHAKCPGCNIMVCTTFGDEVHVMRSLEAGAAGYLLKDSAPGNMLSEIRSLHAGGSPISPLIARQILMRFRQNDKPATLPAQLPTIAPQITLSAREKEVLGHITRGYTSDESADLLGVSRHTVQTYVRRIYSKLEVHSKTEAIYEARNHGLLEK
jgi:DNA-binding NarL/FixJ family response regulator